MYVDTSERFAQFHCLVHALYVVIYLRFEIDFACMAEAQLMWICSNTEIRRSISKNLSIDVGTLFRGRLEAGHLDILQRFCRCYDYNLETVHDLVKTKLGSLEPTYRSIP